VKRVVKRMLARYYVYEQHMRGGRKSARETGKGIRKLELVEERTPENYDCRKADWMMAVYTRVRGGVQERGMRPQNRRAFHS